MKIDRNLKVTFQSQLADGTQVYLYHSPVSLDVWDEYCLTLSRVARHIMEAAGIALGPHNAYSFLISVAKREGILDDVRSGFLAELVRQTTCAVRYPDGIRQVPLYELQKEGKEQFDPEDYREILSGLVFFTCLYRTTPQGVTLGLMGKIEQITTLRITRSPFTEFMSSLQTSTTDANTGETAEAETQ
jgi:hypothetical protein